MKRLSEVIDDIHFIYVQLNDGTKIYESAVFKLEDNVTFFKYFDMPSPYPFWKRPFKKKLTHEEQQQLWVDDVVLACKEMKKNELNKS